MLPHFWCFFFFLHRKWHITKDNHCSAGCNSFSKTLQRATEHVSCHGDRILSSLALIRASACLSSFVSFNIYKPKNRKYNVIRFSILSSLNLKQTTFQKVQIKNMFLVFCLSRTEVKMAGGSLLLCLSSSRESIMSDWMFNVFLLHETSSRGKSFVEKVHL